MADSPELIASLLETAARLLRNGGWIERLARGRCRWQVVEVLEEQELSARGVDTPTGLGASFCWVAWPRAMP